MVELFTKRRLKSEKGNENRQQTPMQAAPKAHFGLVK
jgi:hypothetical protein